MSKIKVQSVVVSNNRLDVYYQVSNDLKKYFDGRETSFWVEYSENIEGLPINVAVIPFVTNVLPVVWLTDSILELDELDEQFFNSIAEFKQGYIDMYPMLNFKGKIVVNKLVYNTYESKRESAAFFSGGVDAFATLIAHIEEKPILLTIWGADVKHVDISGWENVKSRVLQTSERFNLDQVFIKSNFRMFMREQTLYSLVRKSGDSWWHGFQHGIGLIGHAAPLAVCMKFEKLYIASSHTIGDHYTCASDPSIDNKIRFSNCRVFHDQYEYSRQGKLMHICDFVRKNKIRIPLHVCWISSGGENCCQCEKCYRTIYGLLAEGENPIEYGFIYTPEEFHRMERDIRFKIIFPLREIRWWEDIQSRFLENRKNIIPNPDIQWIYTYDFDKVNDCFAKRLKLFVQKIKKPLSCLKSIIVKK